MATPKRNSKPVDRTRYVLRLDDVYFLTVTGNVIKTTPDFGEAPRLSSEDAAYTEALCGIYARQDGEMTKHIEWVQVQV